jgi:hypothetical protein
MTLHVESPTNTMRGRSHTVPFTNPGIPHPHVRHVPLPYPRRFDWLYVPQEAGLRAVSCGQFIYYSEQNRNRTRWRSLPSTLHPGRRRLCRISSSRARSRHIALPCSQAACNHYPETVHPLPDAFIVSILGLFKQCVVPRSQEHGKFQRSRHEGVLRNFRGNRAIERFIGRGDERDRQHTRRRVPSPFSGTLSWLINERGP